jgi:hypothetical protein
MRGAEIRNFKPATRTDKPYHEGNSVPGSEEAVEARII